MSARSPARGIEAADGCGRGIGSGTLVTGSAGAIVLTNAAHGAPAYLFMGLSNVPTPFKGGTLVPVPPLLTLALATSGAGGLTLPWASWPAGLSGFDPYFQYGIQDAGAVHGTALSNALEGHVPRIIGAASTGVAQPRHGPGTHGESSGSV